MTDLTATTAPDGRRRTRRVAPLSPDAFAKRFDEVVANVATVIKGKDDVIRMCLVGMLAQGHVLFEDLPGTGKTMLARALAGSIDGEASRLQCTPDLLPADVTGSAILDRRTGDFVFRPGPVFANVVLVDELNRATPKTQSALLEAMAEGRVTYDRTTHELPSPSIVLATMNPIEQLGTFPLPEAQLDRFLFTLSMGYADRESEVDVLRANLGGHAIDRISPVIGVHEVLAMIGEAQRVEVSDELFYYVVDLVQATRTAPALAVGGSSRASQGLLRAAQVLAAAQGRGHVLPDDVKRLAVPVLSHRLVLSAEAQLREETTAGVLDDLVRSVRVPMGLDRR